MKSKVMRVPGTRSAHFFDFHPIANIVTVTIESSKILQINAPCEYIDFGIIRPTFFE